MIGHEVQIAAFREAADRDRLHHAWLLAGPQGVGKAMFALAAATRLLANAAGPPVNLPGLQAPAFHPIINYIEAGSHPDLRILTRLAKDKTEDLARSISIDQVRALQGLFATTPSLSRRRVVIIDAIDDLERPAANALLKNLEEPPVGTIFFLVSHAPGRLLPTIRSRCRLLRFAGLSSADMRRILQAELPDEPGEEIEALARIGAGSPGRALRFAGLDIATLDGAIEEMIALLYGSPVGGRRRRWQTLGSNFVGPDGLRRRGHTTGRCERACRSSSAPRRRRRATKPLSNAHPRGSPRRPSSDRASRWPMRWLYGKTRAGSGKARSICRSIPPRRCSSWGRC